MRIKDDRDILIDALRSAMYGTEDMGGEVALCVRLLAEYDNVDVSDIPARNRLQHALDKLSDADYTKINNINDY